MNAEYIKEKMDQSRQKMEEGYPLESLSRLDHAEYYAITNNIDLHDEFYKLQDKTYLDACKIYGMRAEKSIEEGNFTNASVCIEIYKTIASFSGRSVPDEINDMKKKIIEITGKENLPQ